MNWKKAAGYAGAAVVFAFVAFVYLSAPSERQEICSAELVASPVAADPPAIALTVALHNGDSGLRSDRCDDLAAPPGPIEVRWRPAGGEWQTLLLDEQAQDHADADLRWRARVDAPACGRLDLELRADDAAAGWALDRASVDVPC